MSDPRDLIRPVCPQFSEAFLDVPHRVCGLRLRPLSNWHLFLLDRIASPVLYPQLGYASADVFSAARICRCRFGEWPAPLGLGGRLRAALFSRGARAEREALRLRDYLADHVASPDFWTEEKLGFGEAKGRAPRYFETASRLILMGWSERDAWEMPVGRSRWYCAAYAQDKGADLDFVEPLTPDMERRIEAGRRANEEARKSASARAASVLEAELARQRAACSAADTGAPA